MNSMNFMGLILLGNALLASIVAIILSAKGRKNPAGRGMGTAGLIIGIITLTLILFGFLFSAFVWPGFLNISGPAETYYPSVKVVEETVDSVTEEAMGIVETVEEAVNAVAEPVDAVEQKVEEVVWDADW